MREHTRILTLALALLTAAALAVAPTGAAQSDNNQGTIKVHDNEDENPDQRNVPHVSCDFWIEGFNMNDDSGWIEFFSWPPTGDKSMVTPTGAETTWESDDENDQGGHHFLAGPFQLDDPGHYRVEVYTDDGHPGEGDHFAKAKTFWVEPCDAAAENPPCPPGLTPVAQANGDIRLTWDAVADVDGYNVYRAVGDDDFEFIQTVTDTTFTDTDTEVGVTYSYYVTATTGDAESTNCEIVEATAIPVFPTVAIGALALVGAVGAFTILRRR